MRRTSGRANSSARSAGLLVALDGREQQLDRPFRRQALRLQRIGQPQAADDQVRTRGAAAVELLLDVLALAELRIAPAAAPVPRPGAARCR